MGELYRADLWKSQAKWSEQNISQRMNGKKIQGKRHETFEQTKAVNKNLNHLKILLVCIQMSCLQWPFVLSFAKQKQNASKNHAAKYEKYCMIYSK